MSCRFARSPVLFGVSNEKPSAEGLDLIRSNAPVRKFAIC